MGKYIKVEEKISICKECGKEFKHTRKNVRMCSQKCRNHINTRCRTLLEFRRASVENTLLHVTWGARSRAKKRGMECNISDQFVLNLLKKQDGKCAATGIVLEASRPDTHKDRKPYVVSIDRIDSSKGYTEDNVQLVCSIFNCCKNCYKMEDVTNMCKEYLKYNNICL